MPLSPHAPTKSPQPDGPLAFSIITPSFNQLDWLRLCVASVRDQVEAESSADSSLNPHSPRPSTLDARPLRVEHLIQDAGTPGIEDFARGIGADFYRDGALVFTSTDSRDECPDSSAGNPQHSTAPTSPRPSTLDPRPYRLEVHCEPDRGMYDAINRGLAKTSGAICAWLNSDEQYLPGTLAKVARYFQQDRCLDVLLGDALLTDGHHNPLSYRRIMVPSRWHTRLDHLHSLSCAMFFKRDALPAPPFDARWKVIGDAVLMDHFLANKRNIRACHELFSAYSFTGSNLSAENCEELNCWWEETRHPRKIFHKYCVLWNRIRRMLSGSYRNFEVNTGFFTQHSPDVRVATQATIGGRWPSNLHTLQE